MRKPVKMHGYFLLNGDMQKSRHTKQEAVTIATKSAKKLGLWPLVIDCFDAGDYLIVNSHTVGHQARGQQ